MNPRSLKTVTDKFVSSTKKCVLLKNISESRSCGKAAARKFFFFLLFIFPESVWLTADKLPVFFCLLQMTFFLFTLLSAVVQTEKKCYKSCYFTFNCCLLFFPPFYQSCLSTYKCQVYFLHTMDRAHLLQLKQT